MPTRDYIGDRPRERKLSLDDQTGPGSSVEGGPDHKHASTPSNAKDSQVIPRYPRKRHEA